MGSNQADSVITNGGSQDQDATEDGKGSRGKVGAGQIESLWTVVVQDLFTSSHERKALGFQLFNILLPHLQ